MIEGLLFTLFFLIFHNFMIIVGGFHYLSFIFSLFLPDFVVLYYRRIIVFSYALQMKEFSMSLYIKLAIVGCLWEPSLFTQYCVYKKLNLSYE